MGHFCFARCSYTYTHQGKGKVREGKQIPQRHNPANFNCNWLHLVIVSPIEVPDRSLGEDCSRYIFPVTRVMNADVNVTQRYLVEQES